MTAEQIHATLEAALPVGRANAVRISELDLAGEPGSSTVRAWIHQAQESGLAVLSSPRVGVWLAADDQEVLEVVDELRGTIHALERRMQTINGGRCALVSCRTELGEKVRRRGGLYCCAAHRFEAAEIRRTS